MFRKKLKTIAKKKILSKGTTFIIIFTFQLEKIYEMVIECTIVCAVN